MKKGLSVDAPVPRFVQWTVVLAVIGALTVAVFHHWNASHQGVAIPTGPTISVITQADGWIQTPWGPLGPADRDLLVKVRQAGLCEVSTGKQAQRQAGSAQVRTIGMRITTEYGDLDNQVRSVAEKLGVPLPDQPNAQQQVWMRELSGLSGPIFDRTFAQRLRNAHGEVLPVIVDERVGTRNDLIRSFATAATVLVNRHMEYLEHTGLVGNSTLSQPPLSQPPLSQPPLSQPPPPAAGVRPASDEPHLNQGTITTRVNVNPANGPEVMIALVVYIAALVGIVGLLYLLGNASLRGRWSSPRSGQPRHALRSEHRSG
jgi:predicted outer membrane protein